MSTEYRLYNVEKKDMYANKGIDERKRLRYDMVMMALEKGNKPTARYFNTYPATVRKWVKIYQEYGVEGLNGKK